MHTLNLGITSRAETTLFFLGGGTGGKVCESIFVFSFVLSFLHFYRKIKVVKCFWRFSLGKGCVYVGSMVVR